jgi:hypothetical protein
MEDSLIGPPAGLVRQIRREGTRYSDQNSNCSPSDFLVADLELDGSDLGPMINYTKEILFENTEEHFDGRGLSNSDRNRDGHRHLCTQFKKTTGWAKCSEVFLVVLASIYKLVTKQVSASRKGCCCSRCRRWFPVVLFHPCRACPSIVGCSLRAFRPFLCPT